MLQGANLMAFVPVDDLARAQAVLRGEIGARGCVTPTSTGACCAANGTTVRLALVEGGLSARPPFTVLGWEVASIERGGGHPDRGGRHLSPLRGDGAGRVRYLARTIGGPRRLVPR